ncbi:MAG: acyl carrier protein [Lachnospiraceae bacterium]|nr:acyl carrier protein [Lachnospiraceae bacterium]
MSVKEEIIKIMTEVLEVEESTLDEDTAIGDIPEWDSLHHLNIISTIENRFGIQFTPDILMDLEDVSDIVKATEDRVKK